jgi:hypothetical protein
MLLAASKTPFHCSVVLARSMVCRSEHARLARRHDVAEQRTNAGFIAAALSGDTSIRRLADLNEGQANRYAMAKAIASGDERLMLKAGLEADIAHLERLRAAHDHDPFAVRRQIRDAKREIDTAARRIGEIGQDIERLAPPLALHLA